MQRFRVKVAGGYLSCGPSVPPPEMLRAMEDAKREAESTPTLSEHLQLSGRVYSLEKEIDAITKLLTIAVMVGGYFLYQWYMQKIGSIPGVDHT